MFGGGSSFSFGGKPAGGGSSFNFGQSTQQSTPKSGFSFGGAGGKPAGASPWGGGGTGGGAGGSFGSFGNQQQSANTGSSFGSFSLSSGQSPSATQTPFGMAGQQAPVPSQPHGPLLPGTQRLAPLAAIEAIVGGFDRNSPYNRFVHVLYNRVDDASDFGKPAGVSDLLWDQAVRNNPDASHLAPVEVRGFEDLIARVQAQSAANKEHEATLDAAEQAIDNLQRRHDLGSSAKLEECRREQQRLQQKLLRLMGRLDALRGKGRPVAGDEEALRAAFTSLQEQLDRPDQHKSRVNELVSLVRMADELPQPVEADIPPHAVDELSKRLKEAARGVQALTDKARQMSRQMKVLQAGSQELVESRRGTE